MRLAPVAHLPPRCARSTAPASNRTPARSRGAEHLRAGVDLSPVLRWAEPSAVKRWSETPKALAQRDWVSALESPGARDWAAAIAPGREVVRASRRAVDPLAVFGSPPPPANP